jgi:peptide/nickel transport system permease protein
MADPAASMLAPLASARDSAAAVRAGNTRRAWRRFSRNRIALGAFWVIVAMSTIALAAPLISSQITGYDPNKQRIIENFAPIGGDHWLGTDEYGRDVLTRLVYGARVSLGVAALATIVTAIAGSIVGAAAAYYGRWVDQVLMRFVDVLMSIPTLSILLLIGSLIEVSPIELAIMIAFTGWFPLARLVRSEVLSVRQREYVESARVLGASNSLIIRRHIMPNVMHLVIIFATSSVASFILLEAALSYLGLGIQAPTASWGTMLNNSTQYLYKSPGLLLYPGIAITITVLAVSIAGNGLRDALDPRQPR